MDKWFNHKVDDLIKEVNAFYNNAANIPLPMTDGVIYALMKLSGATKPQLDVYRDLMLRSFVK
jgi:hypothetical protein